MTGVRPGTRKVLLLVGLLVVATPVAWRLHSWGSARQWAELVRTSLAGPGPETQLLMDFPRELRESSGLAVSVQNPGLFWTHNDSGDGPVVYGLRPGEGVVVELHLAGARAADWEDLALGPCPADAVRTCLYAADIGDNQAIRRSVTVVIAEEPLLAPGSNGVLNAEWTAVAMSYDDGHARDAEAAAVTADGDLIVVSKGREGAVPVFRALRTDLVAGSDDAPVVLRAAGELPIVPSSAIGRMVTGAAFASGGELVVRTYAEAYFLRRQGGRWAEVRPVCFVGHAGPGGEGLDAGPRGVLYLTREAVWGQPAGLDRVDCGR